MIALIPEYIAHYRKEDSQFQSLEAHLLGVAQKAKLLAAKIGLETAGEVIGLLHDLGKYSGEFQDYIKKSVTEHINPDEDDFVDSRSLRGKIDHSSAGAQYIWACLLERDRSLGQILALCIASHHSGLIDCMRPDGQHTFMDRMEKPHKKTHLTEIKQKMHPNITKRIEEILRDTTLLDSAQKAISKLIQINQGDSKKIIIQFQLGLLTRILFSCLIDADRMDTADFARPTFATCRMHGNYEEWSELINRLESHFSQFDCEEKINKIRKNIADCCIKKFKENKGLFTLTVPTGGGKTLASLRFALYHAKYHRLDRIIYVIPFTSIIDQNAKVVRDILEKDEQEAGRIVLEHHSNLLPELQTWKSKILSENWDAPIIYTTMVQLLESLFGGGTREVRRMHQLANSMIVFDEIQTLPIRCTHMFCNAINFLIECCGSSVLLCTATQPLFGELQEKEKGFLDMSKDRELIPDVSRLFSELKRVEVINCTRSEGWSDIEAAQLAISETKASGSCLIVANTKSVARNIYIECKKNSFYPVYHLSTNMCPAHRLDVLREIKIRLDACQPVICVSTQLIEAGIDIDFGSVIRSLAGMDSIAQAAGRCNRNNKRSLGKVYIINLQSENIERLHDIKVGIEKTRRVLYEFRNNSDLLAPVVMDRYFKYYFCERSSDMDYPVDPKQIGRADSLLRLLSTNEFTPRLQEKNSVPLRHSFFSAAKAFEAVNSPTQGILVPYKERGKELINLLLSSYGIEEQFNLLKSAQFYAVNIFPHQLQKLITEHAIGEVIENTEIFYLKHEYYSEEYGLNLTAVNLLAEYIY